MRGTQTIKKIGNLLFRGLGRYFKFTFFIIFLIIPLLYAIVISIQASDVQPGMEYFMPKLFGPLETIQEQSQEAIENQGVGKVDNKNAFLGIWSFIVFYWILLGGIWLYWKWIHLFSMIVAASPWSDKADSFKNYSIGIFVVTTLEIIYLLATRDPSQNPWEIIKLPITIWWTFIQALPYFIQHANVAIGENAGNITQEILTNSSNNTIIVVK